MNIQSTAGLPGFRDLTALVASQSRSEDRRCGRVSIVGQVRRRLSLEPRVHLPRVLRRTRGWRTFRGLEDFRSAKRLCGSSRRAIQLPNDVQPLAIPVILLIDRTDVVANY